MPATTRVQVIQALAERWTERADETLGQVLEGLAPLDVLVALDDEQLIALLTGDEDVLEATEVANLQARAQAFSPTGQLVTGDAPVDEEPVAE